MPILKRTGRPGAATTTIPTTTTTTSTTTSPGINAIGSRFVVGEVLGVKSYRDAARVDERVSVVFDILVSSNCYLEEWEEEGEDGGGRRVERMGEVDGDEMKEGGE